jgi:hypothetical protein
MFKPVNPKSGNLSNPELGENLQLMDAYWLELRYCGGIKLRRAHIKAIYEASTDPCRSVDPLKCSKPVLIPLSGISTGFDQNCV